MPTFRPIPPPVAQTHRDTCWAAVLECWSHCTPQPFRHQTQAALAGEFGEGPTRGITPSIKIPLIASRLGLQQTSLTTAAFAERISLRLQTGHVFCAWTVGNYCHAVLVYGEDRNRFIHFMNPDGGIRDCLPAPAMAARGPFIIMWQETSLHALGMNEH